MRTIFHCWHYFCFTIVLVFFDHYLLLLILIIIIIIELININHLTYMKAEVLYDIVEEGMGIGGEDVSSHRVTLEKQQRTG